MHYHKNETTLYYWNWIIVIFSILLLIVSEILAILLAYKLYNHGKISESIVLDNFNQLFDETTEEL